MIHDLLALHARYEALHPRFTAAFQFLLRPDLAAVPDGKHFLDGNLLYASVEHREGRGQAASPLEAHRRYIDIQYTVSGEEMIGWKALSLCRDASGPFNPERDIGFFKDAPESWLHLPPGRFSIFFPEDAHAPLAGTGLLHKVVMKVAC